MLAVLFAAAEGESSMAPFYIASGLLVAYAALVSVVGILRHETFPPTRGLSFAIMSVGVLLVAAVMVTAVVTS
jgi:hypothetical protein